jgi:hypothetical protein
MRNPNPSNVARPMMPRWPSLTRLASERRSPRNHFSDKVAFIWSVADLLRGPSKPHQDGDVILPLTVLRRLDCVLASTKDARRDQNEAIFSRFMSDPAFREVVEEYRRRQVYEHIRAGTPRWSSQWVSAASMGGRGGGHYANAISCWLSRSYPVGVM